MLAVSIKDIHMPPYVCMPNTTLYFCMFPLYHMFPIHHGDFGGHLYTPYALGCFGGHQYISQAFLCLTVHPFASWSITVIPVAPHHCGLLLCCTGCLWMPAMLYAVVPFLCLRFLLLHLWLLLLWWLLYAPVCHLPSQQIPESLLEGASSSISSAWCSSATTIGTKVLWTCCWPCHCTAATSISDASLGL